jgi:medium-chain acyl-[acyl-carrier-protein] hydrolase
MTASPWIVRFREQPQARLRLFCLPFAGGSSSTYRLWPSGLPSTVEVCAIELPGRAARLEEPCLTAMERLLDVLLPQVVALADRPFALFGHSLGALVAFALTRRLRREGRLLPLRLLVSGRRAPQLQNGSQIMMHRLPEAEFVEQLRRLNGTPEVVLQTPELIQALLPALRADFTVAETYEYGDEAPLPLPITAFAGSWDAEASREQVQAWRAQTAHAFDVTTLPGDHFFVHSARVPLLQLVAERLRCDLTTPQPVVDGAAQPS